MKSLYDADDVFGFNDLYPSRQAAIAMMTSRGFVAEFNILLQCYAHALIRRRHLYVDFRRFPMSWADVFDTRVREVTACHERDYPERVFLGKKGDRVAWESMRVDIHRAALFEIAYEIPELEFAGRLESLCALLAQALFRPVSAVISSCEKAMRELGLDAAPFSAIHVRRGDKVDSRPQADGRVIAEGEFVPLEIYIDKLKAVAPTVSTVFVMTDDYAVYDQAQARFSDFRFVTLCPPASQGYSHVDYAAADGDHKLRSSRAVLADMVIASRAEAFVGVYRSNVSLLIHLLRYGSRGRSASADSLSRWVPM